MPERLGSRAERLSAVRALQTAKGRRNASHFAFEGSTLLEEASRSAYPVEELYVTEPVYEANGAVRELEGQGVPVWIVDERAAAKISDLETPVGLVAISPRRPLRPADLFSRGGVVTILADLSDPGNAGTLVRCADAFGSSGVIFGDAGVDPYHPKVVRAAMGAIFRVPLCVAGPPAAEEARDLGFAVTGLRSDAPDLREAAWPARGALVIGNERHGLGRWEAACSRFLTIGMQGQTESLNAAIAGAIALYEATRRA